MLRRLLRSPIFRLLLRRLTACKYSLQVRSLYASSFVPKAYCFVLRCEVLMLRLCCEGLLLRLAVRSFNASSFVPKAYCFVLQCEVLMLRLCCEGLLLRLAVRSLIASSLLRRLIASSWVRSLSASSFAVSYSSLRPIHAWVYGVLDSDRLGKAVGFCWSRKMAPRTNKALASYP